MLFPLLRTISGCSIPCLLAVVVCSLTPVANAASESKRPSILLVMADDLGFSDLGCYGSEIHTPNLDSLAAGGLRFTQFYNTARCWPTRAALLTGYYAQQVNRDALPGVSRGNRPQWAPLLPRLLAEQGYRSYHSGKWHIDGMPIENGFDRSYLLQDQGRFFSPQIHYEDDRKLPAVRRGTGFYGTTAIVDHAVKSLQEHAEKYASQPFFHYLAFTAPHFPLHALPEDIAKYSRTYDSGWGSIREQRWQRIQNTGLLSGKLSPVELQIGPPYDFPNAIRQLGPGEINRPLPWHDLTDEQRRFQATKMALHAAMIDRMDQELGRVLAQLREMDAFDNTLILFLSDNGASAEIMVRNDGHDPDAEPGSAASYLCLGPGWSTSSNTPFRRHKTWVHEGGISTPLIAHWPAGIAARGELRTTPGHVIDVVPTLLELSGASGNVDGAPSRPGVSLAPALSEDRSVDRDAIWWCHEDNRAIRVGDWKLVAAKGDQWELYDLSNDRTETHDLALEQPERVTQLSQKWQQLTDGIVALDRK